MTQFKFANGEKVKLLTDIDAGPMIFRAERICFVIRVHYVSLDNDADKTKYIIDPDFFNQDGDYEPPFIATENQIGKCENDAEFSD
jgi:hypothetical protein